MSSQFLPTSVESAGFGDYTGYDQTHEFVTVPGVVQVPVASRSAAHRLIRLHGGYGKRITRFAASRFGRPPVMPAAADTNGDTLLGTTVIPSLPRPNNQANGYDWKVSGEYTFAQNAPRVPGVDTFPVGSHPYALPAQQTMAILLSQPSEQQSTFTGFYTDIATNVVDLDTGFFLWPFLALPSVFFSEALV